MASIIKKKIRGHHYYYAVESKRVNGRPRIVWQKYLGKVADIVQAVCSVDRLPELQSARAYSFGEEAALLGIARRLGVEEIINKNGGRTCSGLEIGAGEYILLYAIYFCTGSGTRLSQWFEGTFLKRCLKISPRQITEKRFWSQVEALTEEALEKILLELTERIFTEFSVGRRGVIYQEFTIPLGDEGGLSKNLLSRYPVGMMVSLDFGVPLFYKPYASDFPGGAEVQQLTESLIEKYRTMHGINETTVIGNQKRDWENHPADSTYHVLGALPLEENEELLDIPLSRFHCVRECQRNKIKVYRCPKRMSGKSSTVLVMYSEEDMQDQLEEIRANLEQCLRELRQFKTFLSHNNEKTGKETIGLFQVERRLEDILNKSYVRALVDVSVIPGNGAIKLDFSVNSAALSELRERKLGKTVLFTDNTKLDNEQICTAYFSRTEAEKLLRVLTKRFSVRDRQPVKVQHRRKIVTFCFVLALTLLTLLRRELHLYGVKGSVPEIMQNLSRIQEVSILYAKENQRLRKQEVVSLTEMDPVQKAIYEGLHLKQFEAGADL